MPGLSRLKLVGLFGAAIAPTACGGGGSGAGVATVPPPPPPPPPGPQPIPDGIIGLQSDLPFVVVSAGGQSDYTVDGWPVGPVKLSDSDVQFTYSAADGLYTISIPDFETGRLVTTGANGSFDDAGWINITSTTNRVTKGSSDELQNLTVTLSWPGSNDTLTYSSLDSWTGFTKDVDANEILSRGYFAYGIPTLASDMPVTGSADYAGQILGLSSDNFGIAQRCTCVPRCGGATRLIELV